MKKTNAFKKLFPLVLIFALLAFLMPRESNFPYDYRRGREWKYETLFAQFDFPIYKTEDEIRTERANTTARVIPYFQYSDKEAAENIAAAEKLELGAVRNAVVSGMRGIYDHGVISDSERQLESVLGSDVIYVQRQRRATKKPLSEVYTQAEAKSKLLSELTLLFPDEKVDSLLKASGVYDVLTPNMEYDEATTMLVQAQSEAEISPTSGYVNAGQLIVSEGEIVTEDIERMLDSYRLEFESNVGYLSSPVAVIVGNVVIAIGIVILLYFVVLFSCPKIFIDNRYPYTLLVFTLFACGQLVVFRADPSAVYALPLTLSLLMYQTFHGKGSSFPLYLLTNFPLLLFHADGAVLYAAFAIAGAVVLNVFKHFQKGWRQFIAAIITFAVLALATLAMRAADMLVVNIWHVLVQLFIGSMLTVAGFPLTYLFEKLFNLLSDARLVELSDTSGTLVRRLEQKAPGTFQHSLQVMNMADAVARSVDVNPELVRVGALYHDIGKMNNPLCFVENEHPLAGRADARKYHDGLEPLQSARDIIKHVSDGVEMARKEHMPRLIIDFIKTHHGTTTVRYFYSKYVEQGGDPANIAEFRYPGEKPHTKAQIILMLCDSIEAASRTLKENTPEAYSEFVEGIVTGKMAEGQFDNADMTIAELNTVKQALKNYLAQLNHERIVYPKQNNTNQNKYESNTEQD